MTAKSNTGKEWVYFYSQSQERGFQHHREGVAADREGIMVGRHVGHESGQFQFLLIQEIAEE